MANKITTVFDAETRGFQTGMKAIKKSVADADGAFGKMRAGFKGAITEFKSSNAAQGAAIAGLGAAAFKAVGLASDLEESVNAVNVTFGDAADGVLAIGDNSAKSFGLSKSEFNGLAVQFSSFAQQVAGEGGDVAGTIDDMATRVADFASVMNLDLAEATQVFQSSLAGQTEPIRKYGKDLSAAAVEQYALANGLAASKSEMTEAIKVQARYGLLMEQTADTAGDFANTSDGLANQQRILKAEMSDAAAKIGQDLMPAMQGLTSGMLALLDVAEKIGLTDVLGWADDFDEVGRQIGYFLSPWNRGVREANEAMLEAVNTAIELGHTFDQSQLAGLTTFDEVHAKVLEVTGDYNTANVAATDWAKAQEELGKVVGSTGDSIVGQSDAIKAAKRQGGAYITELHKAGRANEDLADAAWDAARAVDGVTNSFEDLRGEMSDRSAYLDVEDAFANMDATSERSMMSMKGDVLDYLEALGEIPPEQVTDIVAMIDAGSYDAALLALRNLEYRRTVWYTPQVTGTTKTMSGDPIIDARNLPAFADGGIVPGAKGSPQVILAHGGETVQPTHKQPASSGMGGGVTINVYPKTGDVAPQAIVEAIKKFERSNGIGWRS